MTRFDQIGARLLLLGCALFGMREATAGEEKPVNARDAEYRSFVIRGSAVEVVALDVMVVDIRGEPLDGAYYELDKGEVDAVLPLPIGVEAKIQLKALGRKGEAIAHGEAYARFNDSRNGATYIDLATADGSSIGKVLVSPISLRVDRLDTGDPELARYELHALDADRREVAISAEEVTWEIPFPERIRYEPCKPSGTDIVPCIEFKVPVKGRLSVEPEVRACVLNNTCLQTVPQPPPGMPVNGYKLISAGDEHTCALTVDGRILCWGRNDHQQIARARGETCPLPPPFATAVVACGKLPLEIDCPAGTSCRYVDLDAGFRHTCAIDSSGAVWCWGDNSSRQLGFRCAPGERDPNCHATGMPRRVDVPGSEGDEKPRFVQVSSGHMHTCATSAAGNVYCWGANAALQLGSVGLSDPRVVSASSKFTRVSAGTEHSCAVTRGGGLECWGSNDLDRIQPGNPTAIFDQAVDVRRFHPGLIGHVNLVAANRFGTCASTDVIGVVCWGSGVQGDQVVSGFFTTDLELGFVTPSRLIDMPDEVCSVGNALVICGMPASSLLRVPGSGSGFIDSTVGGGHYCGVMADGTAFCWGKDNTFGQMGDGTQANHRFPGRIPGP